MSPRWNSTGSRAFIAQQLQLRGLEIAQERSGVAPPSRVVPGELLAPLECLPARQRFAEELPREGGSGLSRPLGVPIELTDCVLIECQIEPGHDTDDSTDPSLKGMAPAVPNGRETRPRLLCKG